METPHPTDKALARFDPVWYLPGPEYDRLVIEHVILLDLSAIATERRPGCPRDATVCGRPTRDP